ncbi:MAG: ABC transporter ATP-binding protein, partial [Spirochaetales bacterium]|nr:ABC transporter ATP-binding protein [Candidatus Physcosoma equi]
MNELNTTLDEVIRLEHVSKFYGKGESLVKAMDQVDLTVHEGEFVSIMGQSGSGKSTLLYLLDGLETPDEGSVRIMGKDLFHLKDKEQSAIRAKEIGFVFQFFNLVQNLTVEENIMLPLAMTGKKLSSYEKDVTDLLEFLQLSEKRKSFPNQLSGGQQQRVAIARAIITKPHLLLADEPTGNLDSATGRQVMELFQKIHEEMHLTILMVTHSEEVASYSQRKLVMADGKIISDNK